MNADEIVRALRKSVEWFAAHGRNTNTAITDICTEAADLIESLQAQLAESQRRDAAVEDMRKHKCVKSGIMPGDRVMMAGCSEARNRGTYAVRRSCCSKVSLAGLPQNICGGW